MDEQTQRQYNPFRARLQQVQPEQHHLPVNPQLSPFAREARFSPEGTASRLEHLRRGHGVARVVVGPRVQPHSLDAASREQL